MKSKKGALVHWIVLGLLAAIGLFAWLTFETELGVQIKGEWQLDYLRNFYVEGQEELVQRDQEALFAGKKIALLLANNGGFAESSPCGVIDEVYYWNKVGSFCFLEVDAEVDKAFNVFFQKKYGKDQKYTVSHQGKELVGKSEEAIILAGPKAKHTIFPHFRVNLGYSFDDYFQLQNEAKSIVDLCKWKPDLRLCLEDTKLPHWKFTNCDTDSYTEENRRVVFCSESPGKYTILRLDGSTVPVRYRFGLDFTTS